MSFRSTALDYRSLASMETSIMELQKKMASATESMILQQLNEFISRGLIEVQVTQPVIVNALETNQLEVRQSVKLVLKSQEYVEKLEKENAELKVKIKAISEAMGVK